MDEGRFPPGTVLAQRYRIVSLLGRGGMGEVYRANDLLLGQTVALKFLPAAATANEAALSRFRNEVRTARQVSHPNVCRVYDIGEAEGLTYLTMEYVDGEDLASLLRRIGKLPQDKALEISRRLCAGLAAAHDKGVVHRDLKPANIMLDGEGQVRITDFGLAGVAAEVRDVRSGTPAYMAPEQRAGQEVTPRSDIYALGVVLHELFTGKRPSKEGSKPELDPAVERVIQRCLQEDPQKRPATALGVAAALPGGDPLAAALAAGETPSPEVVANAGELEGLRVPVAAACLAAIVIGLVGLCFLRDRVDIVNQVPLKYPPDALAAKAREIANSLGYTDWPVDTAFGWEYDEDYLAYARAHKDVSARWPLVRTNQPPAIRFWYRESPDYLVARQVGGVTRTDPPPFDLGMVEVLLDTEGRLIGFDARPPSLTKEEGQAPAPDWNRLLAAAALDLTQFTPAQPAWTPPAFADAQMAWTGSYPRAAGDSLRLEVAACRGRLVSFRIIGPWTHPGSAPFVPYARVFIVFVVVLPIAASLLAWRNARLGRGDRRGAFRLACFAFLCVLLFRLLLDNHVPSTSEAAVLVFALRDALLAAAIFWVLYMALEPHVRRRSPEMLISWSRLLAGQLRDPLVGAHLLVGGILGVAASFFQALMTLALPFRDVLWIPQLATGTGGALSLWALMLIFAVGVAMSYALLLNLLRFLVRRRWLAALLLVAVLALIFQPAYVLAFPIVAMFGVLTAGVTAYALTRFGVVAGMAAVFVHLLLRSFPLTTHLSAWYAKSAVLAMLSVLALAVYAFHTTLAGRPLWRDELQAS
jgi:serine/threonine-protein kinase